MVRRVSFPKRNPDAAKPSEYDSEASVYVETLYDTRRPYVIRFKGGRGYCVSPGREVRGYLAQQSGQCEGPGVEIQGKGYSVLTHTS